MPDPDREREREADELQDVTDQVDPAQGFEVEVPTPEQLQEDDGYVPGDHGVHLWQQPSEADVLEEEAELDRQAAAEDEEP
jgi:hypothetical protein